MSKITQGVEKGDITPISKTPEEPKKTVVVDAEKFTEFIEDYKKQGKVIEDLNSKVERLTFAADKNRLFSYDERNKGLITPECNIRTIVKVEKDKKVVYIVKGWILTENTVEMLENGTFYTKQTVELILDSNGEISRKEMTLRNFEKNFLYEPATIIAEEKDLKTGSEIVTVKLKSTGKEFKIDKVFIN